MSRFVVEATVCKHPDATEAHAEGSAYPNLYKCPDCGSEFPTVGDTNLWADGIKLVIIGPAS